MGLLKLIFKAFACIVGYIIIINRKNTYFKSEIIKHQGNFMKITKITPVVYLNLLAVRDPNWDLEAPCVYVHINHPHPHTMHIMMLLANQKTSLE